MKTKNLKKAILILVFNLITMVFAAAGIDTKIVRAAGVHEIDPIPCYDVTGSTTAVPVGGVVNGGVMDFDSTNVDAAYQACVRMNADSTKPDHLEGWVWNSNLGWVSLYCAADGKNLGIDCGDKTYQVDFDAQGAYPNFSSVTLSGYIWGDNTGYISFDDPATSNYYQITTIASGDDRGKIQSANSSNTYTWSDSIGYLNWTGVRLNWESRVPVINCQSALPPNDACPTLEPDGTQYKLKIPFKDGANFIPAGQIEQCTADPISMTTQKNSSAYCADVVIRWFDNVDWNQTTAASQVVGNTFGNTNDGPVHKPSNMKWSTARPADENLNYDSDAKAWLGYVKSLAPTSDSNLSENFSNEKFIYGGPAGYSSENAGNNRVALMSLNIMLFKYGTDGSPGDCLYGHLIEANSKCSASTYLSNKNLSFSPLVEVSKLDYKSVLNGAEKLLNFIAIDKEQQQDFQYSAINYDSLKAPSPSITFNIGFENGGTYSFEKVDDPAATSGISNFSGLIGDNMFIGKVFDNPDNPGVAFSTDVNPYVYSTVSYNTSGSNMVKYFSGKLPRVSAGILKNPVAKIQGNVYATEILNKTSDVTIRSLGDVSSNLKREQIMRNVAGYLRGFLTDGLANSAQTIINLDNFSGLTELVPGKVYYMRDADLTIDCSGLSSSDNNCEYSGYKTFIVENGNINVKSNLVLKDNSQGQIGLIATRDLIGGNYNQGNLLLSSNVTWLQNVQVYLDRLLMSDYDNCSLSDIGIINCQGDDMARQEALANQLVFEGTLASMNGIGNASLNPPLDENGGVLPSRVCTDYSDSSSGLCRAKVVDLNYLRYYGAGLQLCDSGVPMDQGMKWLGQDGCQNSDPNYKINSTCIYSINTPECDLVAGGTNGKQSAYFSGDTTDLNNQFPVNFIYRPISRDLLGFETEVTFNPLLQN